jgi:hypothetical protein
MYPYPKDIAEGAGASGDIHFFWPILVYRNVLPMRLKNMYFHSKNIYFLWPILILHASALKCPFLAAISHVFLSQGQPFSLAHFNIAR